MKLAKLSCPIISEALKDRKSFHMLNLYLGGVTGYERTEDGCFLTKIVPYGGKPTLNFKLSLEDYFCNEDEEAKQLWKFIEKKTGKASIEWSVIKIVEL
jgi:hypothetical protein